MNLFENLPVGTIQAYMGDVLPDGWLFCDGIEKENIDNKFNNLLQLNIGKLNNNLKYIPPDYSKSAITSISDNIIDKTNLLLSLNLKKNSVRIVHSYMKNNFLILDHNNNLFKNECNTDNNNIIDLNIIEDRPIKWIIKY
jgi:hypothetical protein